MESFVKDYEHLKIPLTDIESATNNFDHKTKKIGHGGFGQVYKGELSHSKGCSIVAIKLLHSNVGQGVPKFWEEIAILNSQTHKNLVDLLGFCIEDAKMILVYEYASKGSLDHHLRSTDFTWKQRIKTCLDAARGISYLHDDAQGTKGSVVHRDIKSANILLDENWNAKVADMGLALIVPDTGQFYETAGTRGYCDPDYIKTGFLTKNSDVYSFGVVLLEVLCGKLCYGKRNGEDHIIVPWWKEKYRQEKLQEIIFDHLKEQIDHMSLKTYSDLAFQCLNKSPEELTMPDVVKKLETALEYQELHEGPKLSEELTNLALTDAGPGSETELKMRLLKGININTGKTRFSRNAIGEHCELISIAECLSEPQLHPMTSEYESRFRHVGSYDAFDSGFKTRVRTQFLSPQITYTVNLVFKRKQSKERYIGLEYKLEGEEERSYSFVSYEREDGWLMAELYQFTTNKKTIELNIRFYTEHCPDLVVDGIEFQPLKKVEDKVLRDVNLREERLLKHYGEERFLFSKDGKKCLMLPAITVLDENHWKWKSLPETRFENVADCMEATFRIFWKFSFEMLSPKTTYAVFLVYKLSPDYKDINPPLQVVDENSDSKQKSNIFLRTPQTPVISWNGKKEKTLNPSSKPKKNDLPKERSDGWMEIQVHKFQARPTIKMISTGLRFTTYDPPLEGITVQGLEFRPI